jgi:hypothetical protein
VDAEIQKDRMKSEAKARDALADLDKKMVDIELANLIKGRDLDNQIEAQSRVVDKATKSSNSLRSMSFPSQISISIPVVTVSGGGGTLNEHGGRISGVSSSKSYETVYFDNPANDVRDQLVKLADATSGIENARLDGLNKWRAGISSDIDIYKADIERAKEEEMEAAEKLRSEMEELALKHARRVEGLYNDMENNPALLDYRDLNNIISKVWARPGDHLLSMITPVKQDISSVMSVMDAFEVNIRGFESGLTNSSLSQHAIEPLQVHWVWDPSTKLLTENVVVAILDIYEDAKVVLNHSNVSSILDPQIPINQISQMSDKMIMTCIAQLMKEGWFGPKLSKFITQKKEIHDYRNGSRPQAATAKQ